ncbi:MAG TPA: hypothetical protein VHE13_10150 [Opitutus sp.]|nr:hypothetical protein [Opitutus sp.]
MVPVHPQLKLWLDIGGLLADAAEAGARRVQAAVRRPRGTAGQARRPGPDTPMWNACVLELRAALQMRGAKTRLARYLGIPKQRVTDFVRGRRRLPDAELALRMLHWLAEQRAGRDPSL